MSSQFLTVTQMYRHVNILISLERAMEANQTRLRNVMKFLHWWKIEFYSMIERNTNKFLIRIAIIRYAIFVHVVMSSWPNHLIFCDEINKHENKNSLWSQNRFKLNKVRVFHFFFCQFRIFIKKILSIFMSIQKRILNQIYMILLHFFYLFLSCTVCK